MRNFEESNYSDEIIESRRKIRKLLKNHKSEKLCSKSGAEAQMLQCYKEDLNLKRKMIENMEALEENFKECTLITKSFDGKTFGQNFQYFGQIFRTNFQF